MDNLYNVIYSLANDINDMRNAMNIFFYTSNLIVGDMLAVNNNNVTFNVPVNILNDTLTNINNPTEASLFVVGGVYIGKNLYVNGDIICNDDLDIFGNLEVTNLFRSNGFAYIGNDLVNGNLVTNGVLDIGELVASNITGNITELKITGIANIGNIIGNSINLININSFIGNEILFNQLNITDKLTSNLITANSINIIDQLTGNYLEVGNGLITNNLRVNGGANIGGNVDVYGDMTVYGNLNLLNGLGIQGDFDIYGNLNLYGANLTLYNKINSNNDTYITGTLYCEDIVSSGTIISNLDEDIINNFDIYSNSEVAMMNSNIEFIRQNKYCTILVQENITGIISSSTDYLYANLGELTEPNLFIPNVNIIRDSSLTNGMNVGFSYLISGNINGSMEFINLYYPDFLVNNIGCLRFNRFNRLPFYSGQNIEIYKFNISFLV